MMLVALSSVTSEVLEGENWVERRLTHCPLCDFAEGNLDANGIRFVLFNLGTPFARCGREIK